MGFCSGGGFANFCGVVARHINSVVMVPAEHIAPFIGARAKQRAKVQSLWIAAYKGLGEYHQLRLLPGRIAHQVGQLFKRALLVE